MDIELNKIIKSRLPEIIGKSCGFGKVITDHMFIATYKDQNWQGAKIQPYQPISLSPCSKIFHYGQAIFEGLKAYKNNKGEISIFRINDAFVRFNNSAERLCMPTVPRKLFMEAIIKLLKIDAAWMPTDPASNLYIRPFMIATEEGLGVAPSKEYSFIVLVAIAEKYYPKPIKLKIEQSFSRACKGGTGYTKAAANYAVSIYPTFLAQQQGFDQIIWTDAVNHTLIEEAGVMNIMAVINNTLITPPLTDTILPGITRKTILKIANDHIAELGLRAVEERPLTVDELVDSYQHGILSEVFGVGTAAFIQDVDIVQYGGLTMQFNEAGRSVSKKIAHYFSQISSGQLEAYRGWLFDI